MLKRRLLPIWCSITFLLVGCSQQSISSTPQINLGQKTDPISPMVVDNSNWTVYQAPTPVVRVHVDNHGKLWFIGLAGVFSWVLESPLAEPVFTDVYNSLNSPITEEIEFLAFTPDEAIWFGSGGDGLYKFDGANWQRYSTEDGLGDNHVGPVLVETDGSLWVGTAGGGASHFDGEVWRTYATDYQSDQGIIGNFIYSIYQAPDGSIWFGTEYGLSRFYQGNWSSYKAEADIPYRVVSAIISDSDGTIWIGNYWDDEGAILRLDGKSWETVIVNHEVTSIIVKSIAIATDGSLWFATLDGILVHDRESWLKISEVGGSPINECFYVTATKIGNLWFACGEQILRYSPYES